MIKLTLALGAVIVITAALAVTTVAMVMREQALQAEISSSVATSQRKSPASTYFVVLTFERSQRQHFFIIFRP